MRIGMIGNINAQTHGQARTPTWNAWIAMRKRVRDPASIGWSRYGGRGITVDPRWDSFKNFLADMGERPDGMTLDRIDNDGDYTPENCRWATRQEQSNNRENNRLITFDGRIQTTAQWAREVGLSQQALYNRISRGWTAEKALTTPMREALR